MVVYLEDELGAAAAGAEAVTRDSRIVPSTLERADLGFVLHSFKSVWKPVRHFICWGLRLI